MKHRIAINADTAIIRILAKDAVLNVGRRNNMTRKYTRAEKESYLMDVVGYDEGYLEDCTATEINELIEASGDEFEGYMN